MRIQKFLLLTTSLITLSPLHVWAASIEETGFLNMTSKTTYPAGISADGSTLYGYSTDGVGFPQSFKKSGTGNWVIIYNNLGGDYSYATGANSDGSIIVGEASDGNYTLAFRWAQGTGMVSLGTLAGGSNSGASSISADGTTIVGYSDDASGNNNAFRWTQASGMVNLGLLPTGTYSYASSVSSNGSVIVGYGDTSSGSRAFRWTQGSGMVNLGTLTGGNNSSAYAVSGDGNVVVGLSSTASGNRAFRWTQASGMVNLNTLGGDYSKATATNIDGSVVVGEARVTNSPSSIKAFRWTQATGMQNIETLLTNAGVNLAGISLFNATGVDSTGNIISAQGMNSSNNPSASFLIRLDATAGIITGEELQKTLSSTVVPAQQSQSTMNTFLDQSLFAASTAVKSVQTVRNDIAPSAGDEDGDVSPLLMSLRSRNWSSFMVGSFGAGQDNDFDNNSLNGTVGLLASLDKNFVIGAGLLSGHSRNDTDRGGASKLDSNGASLLASYKNDNGLNIYGSLFAAKLDIDIERHYMNGAGLSTSNAGTEGMGYGAVIHTGYDIPVQYGLTLTPYVELEASRTKIDGYTEFGGAFPATIAKSTSDQITSRLGTKISYPFSDRLNLSYSAALAHRIKEGNNSVSASTTGFSGIIGATQSDRNWAETSASIDWQATTSTRLSATLSGRSGRVSEPALSATFGLKTDF